ncbi:hypothetical protein RFI_04413 [Reticulomyxa filosa]|uniref:Uncharacterized protein n=1 Tax=Reticulomyxa filosa TaxID=46433 RepID=X6P3J8_RETFI|nr:hypothetical protein RFI_04413 [Reticulomyxa filosa]|eukprot:ETO32703.1 hypothetical protein RFI_04413 [Reticulomyxa filosa]
MNLLFRPVSKSIYLSGINVLQACSVSTGQKAANIKKTAVVSKALPAPVAPYSHGIKANGMLFISGQLGVNPETKALVNDKLEDQTKQALQNLKIVVTEAGGNVGNIVKTTLLLVDIKDFKAVNEIYAQFFKENAANSPLPARACFAVKDLPLGAKVEIEAIAVE